MNDSNESVPPPPPPPPALTPSPSIVESNSTNSQAPVTERKKRATTEKQLAALKAGREKRWKLMFEALEKERNERVNAEVSSEVAKTSTPSSDRLLEVDSSEESESEDDFVFGKGVENTAIVSTQRQKKYKLSKVVRNRIDEYVERKLYESMYTQPQLEHLNKNFYDEQQQQQHSNHQAYDYSAAYPSRTSYQFC